MASEQLHACLEKLESMIDPKHIARTCELQRRAFAFEPVEHIPTVICYPVSPEEWPSYSFNEIFDDPEKMLLSQLESVYAGAKLRDDRLYGIRPNYGTGVTASIFGCEVRTFEDSLPIGLHLGLDDVERILDTGVPDVRSGIAGRALDTAAYYREVLKDYPKLFDHIGSEMVDIQGPFDNVSIIWGSEVFLALYDVPEKVKRLAEIVTETILALAREHRMVDGQPIDEQGGWWNGLGGLCVRNDSSVSLGREQYDEFAKPYDARLLGELGGWVHFCGRAHQWWESLLDIPGIKGINPYQGEFYDLWEMYGKCESACVPIVQWTQPVDGRCRERIRTGFSRVAWAGDYDEACVLLERLHATGHADGDTKGSSNV